MSYYVVRCGYIGAVKQKTKLEDLMSFMSNI